MPTPELPWRRHVLRAAPDNPLRSLTLGEVAAAPPAAAGEAPAAGAAEERPVRPLHAVLGPLFRDASGEEAAPGGEVAAAEDVVVELPDLGGYPSPAEKALYLLHTAAEIEHSLLAQYLYAAYSLKPTSGVPEQNQLLQRWRRLFLGISREEMGHLMTVQNLLLLTGLALNFEREDFPPRKDLYPFRLHLEPLTQAALAKYVVAESPVKGADIPDILEIATGAAGMRVNRVGVLYTLLGVLFSRLEDLDAQAEHGPAWYKMVRELALLAHAQQGPPESWHLPDAVFRPESVVRQANNEDWGDGGGVRVHLIADRRAALEALRDIAEQGEGSSSGAGDAPSHFERFLRAYRGEQAGQEFPGPGGAWVPALAVPTDPVAGTDFADQRTRRWAELSDVHYAMLLGYLEHYLLLPMDSPERALFAGWSFGQMRSRLAPMASRLTSMPRGEGHPGVAAPPFALPAELRLPVGETARWGVHLTRLERSIAIAEELRSAAAPGEGDAADPFLGRLLTADRARLRYARDRAGGGAPDVEVRFARDILPLWGEFDVDHMRARGLDLEDFDALSDAAASAAILEKVAGTQTIGRRMPPPPAPPWTRVQVGLFSRWREGGHLP